MLLRYLMPHLHTRTRSRCSLLRKDARNLHTTQARTLIPCNSPQRCTCDKIAMESSWPAVLQTEGLQDKIRTAKVLAVGAGGIGCELLKTLVLAGFRDIEVIDLDTIETSNLNRQFLFRQHHVGKSKALVAAEVVTSFTPDAKITAYQANIKEARFGVTYFSGFDIVLNGLDNADARRHVNRLCLAAGVPLVESGTAGYLGQVTVHLKGVTECYECTPKARPKTYPICTLRNTPDKPIHCIVWAKELLFPRLFGNPEAASDLDNPGTNAAEATAAAAKQDATPAAAAAAANGQAPQAETAAAAAATATATAEAQADANFFRRKDGEEPLAYAGRIFDKLYHSDIQRLLGHEELWQSRARPTTLLLQHLVPDTTPLAKLAAAATPTSTAGRLLGLGDQGVWSLEEAARVFLLSILLFLKQRQEEVGSAVFDKDDDLAVDFVTAASNLRSACYGIPQQSSFGARGMAGNIIHAIATTNAIVSGLIVLEALKVLAGLPAMCQTSYINEGPVQRLTRRVPVSVLIGRESLQPPRPDCMVCGKAQLVVALDTHSMTLKQFIDQVVKGRLAVNEPNLDSAGGFRYEEGEGLEEDEVEANAALLPRLLAELPGGGVGDGTIVTVDDQSQCFNVDLIIQHRTDLTEEEAPEGFLLTGAVPSAAAEPSPPAQAAAAAATGAGSSGDARDKKRGRGQGENAAADVGDGRVDEPSVKRQKQAGGAAAAAAAGQGEVAAADEVVLLDDDDDVQVVADGDDDIIVMD